jgi:chromosomal replication initiation ATPase DnaA
MVKATTYEIAKNILIGNLTSKESDHIVLYGSGGNGKSYLLKEVDNVVQMNHYDVESENGIIENKKYTTPTIFCVNDIDECKKLKNNSYHFIDMNEIKFN